MRAKDFNIGDRVTVTNGHAHAFSVGSQGYVIDVGATFVEVRVPGVAAAQFLAPNQLRLSEGQKTHPGDHSVDDWVRESMKKLGGASR